MSRRQNLDESRRNLTAEQAEVRRKQEAKAFELGMPLPADQYLYNRRPLWKQWKVLGEYLLKKRVLSYADGDALLALAEARLPALAKTEDGEIEEQAGQLTFVTCSPYPATAERTAAMMLFMLCVSVTDQFPV